MSESPSVVRAIATPLGSNNVVAMALTTDGHCALIWLGPRFATANTPVSCGGVGAGRGWHAPNRLGERPSVQGASSDLHLLALMQNACTHARSLMGPTGGGGDPRVATLCLESRHDRWVAAEEALAGPCAHAGLALEMVSALNAAEVALRLLPDVDAAERALGCTCYRGWPICEVRRRRETSYPSPPDPGTPHLAPSLLQVLDVRARFPELVDGLNDAEAWVAYERLYACWPRDKARLWVVRTQ